MNSNTKPVLFSREERKLLTNAESITVALKNGWELKTRFQWGQPGEYVLADLASLPECYKDIDEMLYEFKKANEQWSMGFADFINEFGLSSLLAARRRQQDSELFDERKVSFFLEEYSGYIPEIIINIHHKFIVVILKKDFLWD
jgi:hypothetical protein